MADVIEVRSWGIPVLGWFQIDHTYLLYRQNAGTPQERQFYISGTFGGSGARWSSLYGSIVVNTGPFQPGAFDWGKSITASQVITTGENLSAVWQSMVADAKRIDNLNVDYRPLGPNSNSLVHTLLKNAGLPDSDAIEGDRNIVGGDLDIDAWLEERQESSLAPYDHLRPDRFVTNGSGTFGVYYLNGYDGIGTSNPFVLDSLWGGKWLYVGVSVGDGPTDWGWRFVPLVTNTYWATRIPPVILDLDGNGLTLTSPLESPGFDWDGDGLKESMGWFGAGEGALVYDANLNGIVDNGSELSLLRFSQTALTDLEALRAFDADGNGVFDAADPEWSKFKLWRDLNQNGVSDPGEVATLGAMGISSIGLSVTPQSTIIEGNAVFGYSAAASTLGVIYAYDVGLAAHGLGLGAPVVGAEWVTATTSTGEHLAYYRGTTGIRIDSLGDYLFNGHQAAAVSMGPGDDAVFTGYNSNNNRHFFLDGGDGNDILSLSSIYVGGAVQGGNGDDWILGSKGHDHISGGPGTNKLFGDTGSDEYTVARGSFGTIEENWDPASTDGVIFVGYSSTQVSITAEYYDVIVTAHDGSMSIRILNQLQADSVGVEMLFFSDRNYSDDDLLSILGPGSAPPASPPPPPPPPPPSGGGHIYSFPSEEYLLMPETYG